MTVRPGSVKLLPQAIKLEEVFLKTEGVASRDNIYQLIATGELYVNLGAAPIIEPDQVRVFPNKETATAYQHIVEVSPNAMVSVASRSRPTAIVELVAFPSTAVRQMARSHSSYCDPTG
jgi:hypothetical protein